MYNLLIGFFHFYPSVTKKRRWLKTYDQFRLAQEFRLFRVFRLSFASDSLNLLLVKFYQPEIITVRYFIQGRNNEAWVGVEPSTLQCDFRKKRCSESLRHAADDHLPNYKFKLVTKIAQKHPCYIVKHAALQTLVL